ncbi:MAG: amino acid adenylation domain-containing protein [Planctomycetaceae bacterium]|nr:amino acid adenylation domain-containing protein [Planctomycetaceae bacterium]
MIYLLTHIAEHGAAKNPLKAAFRCRGCDLTYRELHRRARGLAAALQSAGVSRGDRVAIFMPKCLETAVSVYGSLMAGAVYFPVDPSTPLPRLVRVLEDAGVSAVLTQRRQHTALRSAVSGLSQPLKLIVSSEEAGIAGPRCLRWADLMDDPNFFPLQQTEDDPAYIIYTSGSTGEPKGILHSHRSGLAYAQLAADTYDVRAADILGNFAPLHFDQSTFDFFAGPLAGATTVMIPEEHMRFPASLTALIEEERLTIWYSVPFALVQLLLRGAPELRDLSSLRWVLYGGEPFPPKHLRNLMLQLPAARFSNVYGPAEVNQCTYYHLSEPPSETNLQIPLGKVWKNTEALIVDDSDTPVRNGDVGELLIRSPTMMIGYWNRQDTNKRAFLDISRHGTSFRFYRTGDLVREMPDGNLTFHGRKDRQVKVRGHRVELDEVEAALMTNVAVQEAAAISIGDDLTGDRRILAFVILRPNTETDPAEVRKVVGRILPSYAVPSEVIFTQTIPQTTTGKVDYRALERIWIDKLWGALP